MKLPKKETKSQEEHTPRTDIMRASFSESLCRMVNQAELEKRYCAIEVMLQNKINNEEKKSIGEFRLLHLLASRRRMLLAHAWLTRVISDGYQAHLIENFEQETALKCQSELLQTFYACDKIKNVPALPIFLRALLVLMLGAYSIILYPQYMAYAFVMKLSDDASEDHVLNKYIITYVAYIALVALGILFFMTLHLVSNELDDPFGSDASDIPLLSLRDALFIDLDDITSVYHLEQQRHREHIKKQFGTHVRTIAAQQRLLNRGRLRSSTPKITTSHDQLPPPAPSTITPQSPPSSPIMAQETTVFDGEHDDDDAHTIPIRPATNVGEQQWF
mmetsp:Transcript_23757/g.29638  ORF Transcript_23757/g.29638 Transcript_23757/m.29638 type:complete len:332 (-) Transcript_23757:2134-3129(-)